MASKGALLSFFERLFVESSKSSFVSKSSLEMRFLTSLSSLSQLPIKMSEETASLLHHVQLLFAPFPPFLLSLLLTYRRDGITLGHLHKHIFPMYFLFPTCPLFATRVEFDIFERIDLLHHILFDPDDASDPFYATRQIPGDRNALRDAAACELALLFRQFRNSEIPLKVEFPRNSAFPQLEKLMKPLDRIFSLAREFPREVTPELVNIPAGNSLYETQSRLLAPLASEIPRETAYANVAPLTQLAQLATRLLSSLPRESPSRLALGVSLLESSLDDRSAVWRELVDSASVSRSRGEVLELLRVALAESEEFHCVAGEVRAQFTREFNRLIKMTRRCDLQSMKLPTYRVRYLKETPVGGRVGHKNLYCDENVGVFRGCQIGFVSVGGNGGANLLRDGVSVRGKTRRGKNTALGFPRGFS